jgi:hypothetical protein
MGSAIGNLAAEEMPSSLGYRDKAFFPCTLTNDVKVAGLRELLSG